jgi:hypothetical protein
MLVRLIVPYSNELSVADARLIRLTEFLGGQCELLRLGTGEILSPEFIERYAGTRDSCFVVNPSAIRQSVSNESFPRELASYLTSRFSFVLIHGVSTDPFTASTLTALSEGSLRSVQQVEESGLDYEIASEHKSICGAFSGLSVGPFHETNQVFTQNPDAKAIRTHITLGGQPFFTSILRERAEVFFLAGANMADLDENIRPESLPETFPRLIPPAMFIRYAFRDECWRPNQPYATLLIDDPLLRKNYGFLNFESLLGLMDEYKFHTAIAFIPLNWRRNSPSVIRLFQRRPDRYSICFHGNDHTGAEFATKDTGLLNAMLTAARERMDAHLRNTAIPCDKVMVFPQGKFSKNAMSVLKAHNFNAAVNSEPYPLGEDVRFTLGENLEPAILKYGGFPLFLRKYVRRLKSQDIAFNLFFGKPILIVEHHEIFKDSQHVTQLIRRIHALAPEIVWSSLQTTIQNSYLKQWSPDGTLRIRIFSNTGSIENASDAIVRCSVQWPTCSEIPVAILLDGVPAPIHGPSDFDFQLTFDLPPGGSRKFSLVYRDDFDLSDANRRLRWAARAFLRRRFSEIRDNYLSKNPHLLSVARVLQRYLTSSH